MHLKNNILLLFLLSFSLFSGRMVYSQDILNAAKEYSVADGTTIELSVTIDSEDIKYEYDMFEDIYNVQLKEGEYPFIIKVKLITIGAEYVGIKDIRVDYKFGSIEEHHIDYGAAQLIFPSTSVSRTLDVTYLKEWGREDFELKVSTTLITGTVDDYGSSDWDLFLVLEPLKNSGIIYVYIFVPLGIIVIIGFSVYIIIFRKRRIK